MPASSASAASALGTALFRARAPWLPPSTSRRIGPLRAASRCSGTGNAAISARTGLPTTSSRPLAKLPGKPVSRRREKRDRMRLVMPGARFCSCTSNGRSISRAAMPPGPAAKPPKAITARGWQRRITKPALRIARITRTGAVSSASLPLPRRPEIASVSMGISCCGTSRVSIAPSAPSHVTGTPRARNTLATARPGKI